MDERGILKLILLELTVILAAIFYAGYKAQTESAALAKNPVAQLLGF